MSKGKKRLLILLSLFSVAVFFMTYQRGKTFSFLDALAYPYYSFNRMTAYMGRNVGELRGAFEENRRLKRELSALRIERQRYSEFIRENKRLNDLLSLKEHEPLYVATVKVIARGYDRLLNTMVLDKGRESGIEKGMAVITQKGLVGKIYSVRDGYSEVLLMKDSNFSVAVRLQNSRREGVASGTGYDICQLKYIPPEENVERGEIVITSGLDGVFPPGLPVGTVVRIKKEGVEFFQHIDVLPFQTDSKLEEVVILKKG